MQAQSALRTRLGRDLLAIRDLDRADLEQILRRSLQVKSDPAFFADRMAGDTVALYFDKPSTRTRVSFVAAVHHLGAFPLTLGPADLQISRGETVSDTAKTLSLFCGAIVIRTFEHEVVEELAAAADVPVINALTDKHHPCQALADVLTIQERFGTLEGLRITYVGEFNNVARSLTEAATLLGADVSIAAPGSLQPRDRSILPAGAGGSVSLFTDPRLAVRGAQVVYTDVWVSMGDEDQASGRRALLQSYRVDRDLFELADPDAVFMHCLPAHRGEEVTDDVIDGPASVVWAQAYNRAVTEEALLYESMSGS